MSLGLTSAGLNHEWEVMCVNVCLAQSMDYSTVSIDNTSMVHHLCHGRVSLGLLMYVHASDVAYLILGACATRITVVSCVCVSVTTKRATPLVKISKLVCLPKVNGVCWTFNMWFFLKMLCSKLMA